MFGRIFLIISRNLTVIWRLGIIAVLTINGFYRYIQEWYYYKRKRNLFKEYTDGFVYKGNYYLLDGKKTDEIPEHIPEIKENEIKNMKKILNAEFPMLSNND